MPLFRRSDGDLVRDEAPSRVILPYLMRGRNESIILHESVCDITRTRVWLRAFNGAGPEQTATLFHLFLWACGRTAHLRPKMNRFVAEAGSINAGVSGCRLRRSGSCGLTRHWCQ